MILKPTKYGTVFASCNSFPKCDNHMNMPKGIISLRMLGPDDCPPERIYTCEKCWKMRRRESFLFRLAFDPQLVNESMAEVLPQRHHTQGVFCAFRGCDGSFSALIEATRSISWKDLRMPSGREGNVPGYYHERPSNKLPKGAMINGCPECGKKKHLKGNPCSLNPNKDEAFIREKEEKEE